MAPFRHGVFPTRLYNTFVGRRHTWIYSSSTWVRGSDLEEDRSDRFAFYPLPVKIVS